MNRWFLVVAAVPALLMAGLLASGCRTQPSRGKEVSDSAWLKESERWYGTPYRWGGNSKRGIDCSGFVQQAYLRVAGVSLPRTTRAQSQVGRSVNRRDLRPGDLVFFNTTGRGVSHVGLMVGTDRFAHASESRGVTYASLREAYWTRSLVGGRRVLRRRANPLTRRKSCQQTGPPVLG